jgi:hypothetical protein
MDEQQIFSMMALAEEHQKAVTAAIAGLAAERAALAKERAALARVAQGIQKDIDDAVSAAVKESLAGASETAVTALSEAAKPVIDRLSGVVRAAGDAEGSLRSAGQWFAWKWVAVAGGGLAGVCLVAYASLWWQLHEVESLSARKAALTADVAQLQANVSALEKKGGLIVMTTCGGRLCIEASRNQGGNNHDWKGSWHTTGGHDRPLVIPRGY